MKRSRLVLLLVVLLLLTACHPVPGELPTDTSDGETVSSDTNSLGASDQAPFVFPEALYGGVPAGEVLSGDLAATSVCTLKNLPKALAVQRFSIVEADDAVYIFTTQRSGSTVYLSRCLYSEETKTARRMDYIALEGFGHGESLEVVCRDGKFYVYVAGGANRGNDYYWGTNITRFVYERGKMSDVKTLTDLHCATADGTPVHANATPYRCNFSFNEPLDRLVLYLRCDTDYSLKNVSQYLASYRFSEIDRWLDEAEESVSLKDCGASFVELVKGIKTSTFCPNSSFQGMDLTDDGTFYVSGGAAGQQPGIYRFTLRDGTIADKELCDVKKAYTDRLNMSDLILTMGLPEIESFQVLHGRYYITFNPTGAYRQSHTEIYVLSKLTQE